MKPFYHIFALLATLSYNELTIVKDAPHFGKVYDVEEIKNKVISFLKESFK